MILMGPDDQLSRPKIPINSYASSNISPSLQQFMTKLDQGVDHEKFDEEQAKLRQARIKAK